MFWSAVKMGTLMYSKSSVCSVLTQQIEIFIRIPYPHAPLLDPLQIVSTLLLTFDVFVPVREMCVLFDR